MDYVIFGIGMGASLVLFGLGSRTVGPSLRYRKSAASGEVMRAEELVARIAWGRFCGSLGATIAIGGGFLLIVTVLAMLLRVSDRAATISVLVAVLLVVAMMVLWAWAFVNRFGLYGIVTEREMQARRSVVIDDDTAADSLPDPTIGDDLVAAGPPPIVNAARKLPNQPPPQRPAAAAVPRMQPSPTAPARSATGHTPEQGILDAATSPAVDAPQPALPQRVVADVPESTAAAPGASPQPPARNPDRPAGPVASTPSSSPPQKDPAPAAPDTDPPKLAGPPIPVVRRHNVVHDSDAAALDRILNTPDAELRGTDDPDDV